MKQVRATMAGTILRLLVDTGNEIESGADVIVLESMKMEVPMATESAGKVTSVKVQIGDFVNEGDVLVELE
ncbi:acetyl-CoA carboxylase biotin carboxyl carrier protein subunit [Brevibacillus daliensis]|uniref:acetyl-CoA carboxylase biotin carboxyl carrier protein subunit n=1 Tax=Brevibacillus daliensis TaxID=2892995 RepID=UPI001E4A53EA|nr:acetyl-CoA carboxylase biotin carboxyl carrier protein subunit [Brevibacillus daliensis]